MVRTLLVVLVLLTPLALADEGPVQGDCDDTGKLVCAGAEVGADARCFMVNATFAKCAYTYGNVWTAFSPVGLPGNASGAVHTLVESCVVLCAAGAAESSFGCDFLGVVSCDGGEGFSFETAPVELALGQCLRVSVTQRIDIEATVVRGVAQVARAEWTHHGVGAGAVCLVDDGR